jgi:hypothetical protein
MTTHLDRHGLIRLAEDECWALLARHTLGRVAFVFMRAPVIFPVNYALDGRSIVFRTDPGTKLSAASVGRGVVFEVDEEAELLASGASVMVHGRLLEVTDEVERDRLARLPIRPSAPGALDHLVRIEALQVTGRRIPRLPEAGGLEADAG